MTPAACDVTVITAAYNCEQFLEECVRSVQEQTLPPREHIIVDDCSTDGTHALALRLASEHTKVPIRVLETPQNGGAAAARNLALEASASEFLGILDSDDRAFPDWLEVTYPRVAANASVAAVGGGTTVITEDGVDTGKWEYCLVRGDQTQATRTHVNFPFVHSGCLVRTSALRAIDGYTEALRSQHDCDMLLGLAFIGRLLHTGRPLIYRRRCRTSVSLRTGIYTKAVAAYLDQKRALLADGHTAQEVRSRLCPLVSEISSLPRIRERSEGQYEYELGMSFLQGYRPREAAQFLGLAATMGYRSRPAYILRALALSPLGPLVSCVTRVFSDTALRARSRAKSAMAALDWRR